MTAFHNHTRLEFLSIDSGSITSYTLDFGHEERTYTNVVGGLMCFYRDKQSWLYNIATREMVKLPDLTTLEYKDAHACNTYHLGFDPISKRYKLVNTGRRHMAILTIGVDCSWRMLAECPLAINNRRGVRLCEILTPFCWDTIDTRCVCLGGILWWKSMLKDGEITAVKLFEEELIHFKSLLPNVFLVRFGPRMAITERHFTIELPSKFLYYEDKSEGWVDEPFELPGKSRTCEANYPRVVGILPNGKLILYLCLQKWPFYGLYSFDRSRKELKEIRSNRSGKELKEVGSRQHVDFENWSCFEENIISLTHLTSCNNLEPNVCTHSPIFSPH